MRGISRHSLDALIAEANIPKGGHSRSRVSVMKLMTKQLFGMRSDLANLVALLILWVLMVVAVDPIGDFPVQDDWAYGLAVRSLVDEGVYRIPSFVSANLGPLVHWGALFCWPFGFSFTALRVSTLVMGLFGGFGIYFLFREVWSDRRLALVAAVTLLINPIYLSLANTFMTDVPFVALISLAMALIVRGMRSEDNLALVAGLGLCLVSVLVRQFALVIFGGFACAWVAKRGTRLDTIVKALIPLAVGIISHVVFNRWLIQSGRKEALSGIADITTASIGEFAYSSAHELFVVINELGLFLLPIAVLCFGRLSRRAGVSRSTWPALLAIAVGAAMAAFMLAERITMPLTGDTLHYFGIGPLMLRDTLLIGWNLPVETEQQKIFWIVMTGLAIVGAALIVFAFARGASEMFDRTRTVEQSVRRAWPAIFFAATGLAYLGILLLLATRHDLFDRYLLPLFIVVALALPLLGLRAGKPESGRAASAVVAAALFASAAFSVVATHDFLAWNRTRWAALSALMREGGVNPRRIDGGYEFNGWFLYDPRYELHAETSWWWVDDDEYMIGAGPMPGRRIERRLAVDRWWTGSAPDVFVLRRND